jgi:hypothetical protein
MVRTQVQLTEEQAAALKAIAAERGSSVAALVRESVDAFITNTGAITPEERKRRALSIVGRYNSGISDLATEHDRYLNEDDSW